MHTEDLRPGAVPLRQSWQEKALNAQSGVGRPWEVIAATMYLENSTPKKPEDKERFRVYGLRVPADDAPELFEGSGAREPCIQAVRDVVGPDVLQAYVRWSEIKWIVMIFRTLEGARTARLAVHDRHVAEPGRLPWQLQ